MSTGGPKLARLSLFVALVSVTLYGLTSFKIGTFVQARGYTTYQRMVPVFAQAAGVLKECANADALVDRDELLIELESPELEMQLLQQRGQVDQLRVRLDQLNTLSVQDSSLTIDIANVSEELTKAEEILLQVEQRHRNLKIIASETGRFRANETSRINTFTEKEGMGRSQPTVSGANRGLWIEKGQQVGWLCSDALEVVALVGEENLDMLFEGMPVRLRWDSNPGQSVPATLKRIVTEPIEQLPASIAGESSIPALQNSEGEFIPLHPHFKLRVSLQEPIPGLQPELLANSRLTLHFETTPRTLWDLFSRWINQSVRPNFR